MSEYTTVKEQIEFGLDQVDGNETIEVNLKDLLYVFKTLEELNNFFHQPMHYPTIQRLQEFLGDRENGAYSEISKCYYSLLWDMLPKKIQQDLENGEKFTNPKSPHYYETRE